MCHIGTVSLESIRIISIMGVGLAIIYERGLSAALREKESSIMVSHISE